MCSGVSGTTEPTTLTVEQTAAHAHESLDGGDFMVYGANGSRDFGNITDSLHGDDTTAFAGGSQPHAHTLTGSVGSADSLPPYYSLSLIMRVS